MWGLPALQAAEAKHAAGVESLKEGWVVELKRQKEAWSAAEKARRDTWLADKTKQVKELTVKVALPNLDGAKGSKASHNQSVRDQPQPRNFCSQLLSQAGPTVD